MAKQAIKDNKSNLPAKRSTFASRAGGGMEETTADSFSIPFLAILQKGSPQVDEASGKQLKGAKAGMLFDTVTKELIDGKVGCEIVQCHYRRSFLRWGAREEGGGFKGEITPEALTKMRNEGQAVDVNNMILVADKNGEVDPEESDRIVDTRVHYLLRVDRKKGTFKRCVLSLSRTQVRKSKDLMSRLAELRFEENGEEYQPASYQSVLRIKTVPEKNDQGTWYGVEFEIVDKFDDPTDPIFLAAEAFKEAVKSGVASAKMGDDGTE